MPYLLCIASLLLFGNNAWTHRATAGNDAPISVTSYPIVSLSTACSGGAFLHTHIPPAYAENETLTGCVTDAAGVPLIGASIVVKDTDLGTVTDVDGCFELAIAKLPVILVVSYTGFTAAEVEVKSIAAPQRIVLREGVALDEVVVVGATPTIREDRTASVAASGKDRRSLRGKAAGVSVKGSRTSKDIRIRGYAVDAPPPPPPAPTRLYREAISTFDGDDGAIPGLAAIAETGEAADVAAGQLTAGEVSDFAKWEMWADIAQEDLGRYRAGWSIYPDRRYAVQVTARNGSPLVDCEVQLQDASGAVRWSARTDNTGKAELWHSLYVETADAEKMKLVAIIDGKEQAFPTAHPFANVSDTQGGLNVLQAAVACRPQRAVDIAFVVDATGSMADEIDFLKAELLDVLDRVQQRLPESDLRTGTVFYRDTGDAYLTREQPFTPGGATTVEFIKAQQADGGGDTPEAVDAALAAALDLDWRTEAAARLLFLVLDAPPHTDPATLEKIQQLTQQAARRGVRIIPVTGSGIDKSTEYLMRSLALATNGTYTFLTNHSGIGGHHIEPSTDAYEVEMLNDLLVRLCVQFGETAACDPVFATTDPIDTEPITHPVTEPNANPLTWRYYPNPTAGPVQLSFSDAGQGTLFLADSNGKLLERFALAGKDRQLDFSRYPAGRYLLVYEAMDGGRSTGQLLLTGS